MSSEMRTPEDSAIYSTWVREMRLCGWTLTNIGEGLGITREAIRLAEKKYLDVFVPRDAVPLPVMPRRVTAAPTRESLSPYFAERESEAAQARLAEKRVPEEVAAELRRLQEAQKHFRANCGTRHPARIARGQLDDMVLNLRHSGYSVYAIAIGMGVTHTAVFFRLGRLDPDNSPECFRKGKRNWGKEPESAVARD